MNDAPNLVSMVRWPRLLVAVCAAGMLALTVHVTLVQWLHVSNPSFHSVPAEVLNTLAMVYAAAWLYDCIRSQYGGRSAALHVIVLFAVLACLNGTVRNAFMTGYCSTTTPLRWLFGALSSIRPLAYSAIAAASIAWVCRFRQGGRRLAAGAAAGLGLALVVAPVLALSEQAMYAQLAHLLPSAGWCKLPYGIEIMVPAYLTAIEPALGSFACIAIVWPHLPLRPVVRTASFVVLVLALKKQLLASFLYALLAPGSAVDALVSMGQLSLSAALLGLLTVWGWRWAQRTPVLPHARRGA
jgi:hypothetical protein